MEEKVLWKAKYTERKEEDDCSIQSVGLKIIIKLRIIEDFLKMFIPIVFEPIRAIPTIPSIFCGCS